jgi:hypothetical protein
VNKFDFRVFNKGRCDGCGEIKPIISLRLDRSCAACLRKALAMLESEGECPTCGAPTLKPGERHGKIFAPVAAKPIAIAPDDVEDSAPDAASGRGK